MKFWQAITWAETEQLPEIARFAEAHGFHGLMGGDHAVYPESVAPTYPYSEDGLPPMSPEDEYPEQHVLFAALAAVTTTLKFTTGVYVLPARNPHEVARATATLAILSGGRFILGAGVGWMREEFDIYGVDFTRRGKRTDEMIDVLRALWGGGMVEYHGEHFDFPRVQLSPVPEVPPPIYIGGTSEAALRRAARVGDGYIGAGTAPEDVPALLARLGSLRREYDRADQPFEAMLGLTAEPSLALYQRMAEQGLESTVAPPFAYVLGKRSSLDAKKRAMEAFAEDIIRHL
ncbi:MAG: TIGR03619 family F420-dependent LLM class oxidoreductase [Halieaceae bacterium]|jgi:probable F420-dependent oxidoreductase|nr:TIGR03619 family F420-dependent LLM class oxidoreductase [Halieaceae bacterium]